MTASLKIRIGVECYAGVRADERPTALILEGRRIAVREIRDRWMGEDHAYFKIVGADGAVYLIRQDRCEGEWQLVLCELPSHSAQEYGR
jgi:hypothetical protein